MLTITQNSKSELYTCGKIKVCNKCKFKLKSETIK